MGNVIIALILLALTAAVFAGSECPDSELSPCLCINIQLSKKKLLTFLYCHGLRDTEQLRAILTPFAGLTVDNFYMYDSYWNYNSSLEEQNTRTLPKELFRLHIKEIEIADSKLSACFACEWDISCGDSELVKLTVRNSTSDALFCNYCNTPEARIPWMACIPKIEHFEYSYAGLTRIHLDYFPVQLKHMKFLDFSHNEIQKIDESVFRNLPHLKKLDLSHNKIDKINRMFNARTEIEYLDLSNNSLTTLTSGFIPALPKAKTLLLANNKLGEFKFSEWSRVNKNINRINLSENPINCNCDLQWVNHTFTIKTVIEGKCAAPEEYSNSRLRRASIAMNQRCDDNGVMGPRRRS